jgi:hypothetical protein
MKINEPIELRETRTDSAVAKPEHLNTVEEYGQALTDYMTMWRELKKWLMIHGRIYDSSTHADTHNNALDSVLIKMEELEEL